MAFTGPDVDTDTDIETRADTEVYGVVVSIMAGCRRPAA